jgi:hypothetical protein
MFPEPRLQEVEQRDRERDPSRTEVFPESRDLRRQFLVFSHMFRKQCVVLPAQKVLFVREMDSRVLHQILQDVRQVFLRRSQRHRIVQGVDERDQPLVLRVDVFQPEVKVGPPFQECHAALIGPHPPPLS